MLIAFGVGVAPTVSLQSVVSSNPVWNFTWALSGSSLTITADTLISQAITGPQPITTGSQPPITTGRVPTHSSSSSTTGGTETPPATHPIQLSPIALIGIGGAVLLICAVVCTVGCILW